MDVRIIGLCPVYTKKDGDTYEDINMRYYKANKHHEQKPKELRELSEEELGNVIINNIHIIANISGRLRPNFFEIIFCFFIKLLQFK